MSSPSISPAGSQSAQTWRVKQLSSSLAENHLRVNNKLIKFQIFPLNQLPKLLGGSNRAQRWVAQQNGGQMPPILRRKIQANLLLAARSAPEVPVTTNAPCQVRVTAHH